MNDEQFIAEVKNLAELDADEDARKAIAATLETLKERLAGEESSDLAAQLPPEIAPYVEGVGGGESFSVEEFYERVAQKEGVGKEEAVGQRSPWRGSRRPPGRGCGRQAPSSAAGPHRPYEPAPHPCRQRPSLRRFEDSRGSDRALGRALSRGDLGHHASPL
jgi:Uncharacterized conserved protein (DUF2267)